MEPFVVIAHLLNITYLLFIALFVGACARRWPAVAKVLWTAFVVRSIFALFHFYIAPLVDSGSDAVSFELTASEWAQDGFVGALGKFPGPSSKFISWIISLFYATLGSSMLLAQSLSVFMGTGMVLLGWLLARELWDERTALKVGWVLTFFPTLILYSALTMRESYIYFFLTLSLLGVVRWVRTDRLRPLLLATFGFVASTFFHGAMFVGLLVFASIVLWRSLKSLIAGLLRLKISVKKTTVTFLVLVILGGYLNASVSVDKIGDISNIFDIKVLILKTEKSTRSSGDLEDGASFPVFLVPNSNFELLYKTPIRMIYFAFAPFPWDVKKLPHLIGVADGLMYLILFYLICRNRKAIWADRAALTILFILLVYLLAFGIGTGNFGTGIRHRSKLVIMFIILAAPYLPYFRWHLKRRRFSLFPVKKRSKLLLKKQSLKNFNE